MSSMQLQQIAEKKRLYHATENSAAGEECISGVNLWRWRSESYGRWPV